MDTRQQLQDTYWDHAGNQTGAITTYYSFLTDLI